MKKKKLSKDDLKEAVKELYLTLDDNGKQKHSLREIENIIAQNFHNSIGYRQIANWSKENKWDVLLNKAIINGVAQATINNQPRTEFERTNEEKLINQITMQTKDIYDIGKWGIKQFYEYFKENGINAPIEAVKVGELSIKILSQYHDIIQDRKSKLDSLIEKLDEI